MPVHDWTRADAGIFHSFHQLWIGNICTALNEGVLPDSYFALLELAARRPVPDVLTLHLDNDDSSDGRDRRQLAVAEAPPRARLVKRTEAERYLEKVDRITVRHRRGEIVAVIEIVSPGNKHSKAALRSFVEKAADFIQLGIHLLVIDLFPPTKRDPQGIHKAIWDEFEEDECDLPADKPLTLASYEAGPEKTAYVNFVGVGDILPDQPLFLQPERYVLVPVDATYQETWRVFPAAVKKPLLG
ncbi:MAG TPA: DUF4058 family protein [Gemmataceae bacterium]|nr:DUF4058 family protein [Gemmataceae bacterium]